MARPSARAVDHGQATCKGGRPRPAPLQGQPAMAKDVGASTSKRRHSRPRPSCKGRVPVTHPQGVTANGQLVRGDRQRPARKGLLPAGAAAPAERVAAT
ncbi:hypothetical protein BHE74_00040092 [Ensete ventricosum]|nr:hypothetical protein GW17_00050661 [Ensete ventricosum]RWW53418.1 hypothetical protein BHE74_00040092 [Ensete ventricosum]